MITVEEAHEHVRRCAGPLPAHCVPLTELLGLRLAEDVTSRVDSPPFDKALVDGYAVATSDRSETLQELELVTAGSIPTRSLQPGATIRVMTGAPIPQGADAVMQWEDCQLRGEGLIQNPSQGVRPGDGVLKRGAAFHAGQLVLNAGKRIGPRDIALLAEIGQPEVMATPTPRVAVLATGDELVAAHEPLAPGQIRNSNGPMLLALVADAGGAAVDLGVARDDPADLRKKIARGLECDVLLVSGGVSAGVKDLAPGVLTELGVAEQFHQVRVKPGKPLWFGVKEWHAQRSADGRGKQGAGSTTPFADSGRATPTLVFGLPGNPVSTLVSFRLFVLPALDVLAGAPFAPPATIEAKLAKPLEHRGKRPTYFPCARNAASSSLTVTPLDWKGSADLATLTKADFLAALPPGDYRLDAGAKIQVLPL